MKIIWNSTRPGHYVGYSHPSRDELACEWKIEGKGTMFYLLLNGHPVSKERTIKALQKMASDVATILGHVEP